MEVLIKEFLTSYDDNDGSGYGSGNGNDYGEGHGYTDDNYYGQGDGSGACSSSGYNYSHGYGSGCGCDDGSGFGCEHNSGLKEICGNKIYIVDNIQTIITSVHGNVAQGFILQSDLQLKPCYIVKENNEFAHGDTLRDAFTSLQEKLYDDSTKEERIEAFIRKFPSYDIKYDNRDLFTYHHVLTGSCRMGRELFVADKGLSLDGKTTVREFVELTKDAYGGDIIKQLSQAYET